jgi:PAS domain S-box-containing protein
VKPSSNSEALAESERRFRSVVEELREGVFLTDEKGSVTLWNREMQRISGMETARVMGRFLWDVQYEVLSAAQKLKMNPGVLRMVFTELLTKGVSPVINRSMEELIERADGTKVTVEARLFPIQTERGFLISGIMQQIGDGKPAENALAEAETRFRALVENWQASLREIGAAHRGPG